MKCYLVSNSIEGYPVIIRFKTIAMFIWTAEPSDSIEGYPVIIRFKTYIKVVSTTSYDNVLKVIQL